MRARAAYISSFGTSGILVASALLVLAMVSTLVAFRGWPDGLPSGDRVTSVPLTPSAGPAPGLREPRPAITPDPRAVAGVRAVAARTAAASGAGSIAGLSKDSAVAGGGVGGVVKVPAVAEPEPVVPIPPPSTGQQSAAPQPAAPTRDEPPKRELIPELPAVPVPEAPEGTTDEIVSTLPDGTGTVVEQVGSVQQELAEQTAALNLP